MLHATSVHESCTFRIRLTTRTKGQTQTHKCQPSAEMEELKPRSLSVFVTRLRRVLMALWVAEVNPQFWGTPPFAIPRALVVTWVFSRRAALFSFNK